MGDDAATDTTVAAKRSLRARVRDARAAVSETERRRRDAAIAANLVALLQVAPLQDAPPQDAAGASYPAAVAAFAGLPGEPGGATLPDVLRDAGHEVWLPVVAGPARPLTWLPYLGGHSTRTGAFGITEPEETPEVPAPISTVELATRLDTLVLPALAIDRDGTRLGQGGGFYDRTLAIFSGGPKPGRIAGVVDHAEFGVDVPRTPLDIQVGCVVTDAGSFAISTTIRDHR